ncbi:GTP-binding protein Rit1-like [Saccostrea echinata]|uniref:GTP-binding protein Rit1-like n=1 Tax=Saccostrea echinata TaxID=191078 RepID=UPI002A83F269|nr:GTP-binding protein Rit1-like [Saccostrea echinata]
MYHTMQPRKVLRLENKKKSDASSSLRKSFRKQCKTFSCYDDEFNQKILLRVDDKVVHLVFHETDLRMQRDIPHRDSDAFLLVYSLEDRRSLSTAANILRLMRNKYKAPLRFSLLPIRLILSGKCPFQKMMINVIGSPKVGKTSLIQRLKRRQWNPDFPACGDDVCKQKVQVRVDDKVVRLVFHETDLRMQRDIPHQDSDAFLLVYSLEDRRTLSTAAKILRQMRNKYKVTSPIFLIANKLDLVGKVSISKDDGKLLEKEFKCKYMETSLLHQTDFHELFLDIIRNILVKDEFYYDEESIFELDSLPANKKKIKGPMFRFLSSIFKCCSK